MLAAELAEEALDEALLRADPAELLMDERAEVSDADEAEERRLDWLDWIAEVALASED